MVGMGSLVSLMVLGCCALGGVSGDTSTSGIERAAAASDVNLEKLTEQFEVYVTSDAQDLNGFEQVINDKTRGIYKGDGYVNVTLAKDGGVIGFENKDAAPTYDPAVDEKVFELQVAPQEKQVIARDRYDNHYRYHPTGSGFFTGMLIGSMLSSQRSYYPRGSSYRPPANTRYQQPGYYNRARSSGRSSSFGRRNSGSRSTGGSFRGGSSYGGGRSGGRSGGFGSGK